MDGKKIALRDDSVQVLRSPEEIGLNLVKDLLFVFFSRFFRYLC